MNNQIKVRLKSKIMNRVFRFWFLRSMAPLIIFEVVGILLAVYIFANLIFVLQVFNNAFNAALGNPFKFIAYFWDAFLATRSEVKVIIIALAISGLLLLRDINRGIISYAIMKRNQRLIK